MRRSLSFIAFPLCISLLASCATSSHTRPPQTPLEALREDVQSQRVKSVVVYWLPYGLMTYASVSPEGIVDICTHPFSSELDEHMRRDLIEALKRANPRLRTVQPDARWGARFFEADGKLLHEFYLDKPYFGRWSNEAIVDGKPFVVSRSLRHWFEKYFGESKKRLEKEWWK